MDQKKFDTQLKKRNWRGSTFNADLLANRTLAVREMSRVKIDSSGLGNSDSSDSIDGLFIPRRRLLSPYRIQKAQQLGSSVGWSALLWLAIYPSRIPALVTLDEHSEHNFNHGRKLTKITKANVLSMIGSGHSWLFQQASLDRASGAFAAKDDRSAVRDAWEVYKYGTVGRPWITHIQTPSATASIRGGRGPIRGWTLGNPFLHSYYSTVLIG